MRRRKLHRPPLSAPLSVLVAAAALLGSFAAPRTVEAASGLYLQLGLGYGKFSGSDLIVQEDPSRAGDLPLLDTGSCCPPAGLATQARIGFSLFGFGGPEAGLFAHGWNLGSDTGGAGFVGGGLRLYLLKFIGLTGLDTSEVPLELSTALMFGYAVAGKDFAYSGTFWDWDFSLEYEVASFMSAGLKLDMIFPQFSDFVFTSYKDGRGRCLDSGGNQRFDIGMNGIIPQPQAGDLCNGRGPSTTLLSPQLVVTFHFDLLDL